jgi:hypothetical protein
LQEEIAATRNISVHEGLKASSGPLRPTERYEENRFQSLRDSIPADAVNAQR